MQFYEHIVTCAMHLNFFQIEGRGYHKESKTSFIKNPPQLLLIYKYIPTFSNRPCVKRSVCYFWKIVINKKLSTSHFSNLYCVSLKDRNFSKSSYILQKKQNLQPFCISKKKTIKTNNFLKVH